jgi:hypothetical protein
MRTMKCYVYTATTMLPSGDSGIASTGPTATVSRSLFASLTLLTVSRLRNWPFGKTEPLSSTVLELERGQAHAAGLSADVPELHHKISERRIGDD